MSGTSRSERERITPVGTRTRVNKSSSGVILSPSSGKRLRLLGFILWTDAAITASIRWTSTGADIAGISQQGVFGLNLVGVEEVGDVNEALYAYISGTGNLKGTVWTEEIA